MRRNRSTSPPPSTMSDSTATSHPGYRLVPTTEGAFPPRSSGPTYSPKSPRSALSLFSLAAVILSLSLLFVFLLSDMPIKDRLKAALFNSEEGFASKLDAASVKSLNAFGLRLFGSVVKAAMEDNVVLSPASVASALSMVAVGATKGGDAEKELEAVLKHSFGVPGRSSDSAVQLKVANSAWVKENVLDSYKKQVAKLFGAEVKGVPEDVTDVNGWVEKATEGGIKTIMDSIPGNVVALLINAVYFKASWTTSFDEGETVDAVFYKDGGKESGELGKVKMMSLKKEMFNFAEVPLENGDGEWVKVVELPYGSKDEYSAVAVMPTGKTKINDIAASFEEGGAESWDKWIGAMRMTKLDVLAMPRFKIEYGVKSLKHTLQSIGIKAAFASSAADPQFLRMTLDKGTYLDDVLHKATIECTEKGTVASAATAAIMMMRSAPRQRPTIVLDRPFLFAVRNRMSGALLFIAKVDQPVSP